MSTLSEQEVRSLVRDYQEGRDVAVRNRIIEQHLDLVAYIARKLHAHFPRSVDVDDLISAGVFGLMDAIDGFDATRKVKFETYCTIRIRGSILDQLREQDWVPRLVRRKASKISTALRDLTAELGRDPTSHELAEHMGITSQELEDMRREIGSRNMLVSLDIVRFESPETRPVRAVDLVEHRGEDDPSSLMAVRDAVDTILRSLNRREKLIVILYYKRHLTMRRIGTILGMSESRVCQIHSVLVRRLKNLRIL